MHIWTVLRLLALNGATTALLAACAVGGRAASPPAAQVSTQSTDASAVRAARAAQNRAIAALDTAAVASFWTEDVEIRRGLGALVVGREAHKRLFNPGSGAVTR